MDNNALDKMTGELPDRNLAVMPKRQIFPRGVSPLKLVLCAAAGSFLFGFNVSLLNTSMGAISRELHWCGLDADDGCNKAKVMKAFISTAVFIGAACGAMTSGRFISFGRRLLLLLCMLVFIIGIVSSCTANSFSALLWARLVVGYGVGVVSVIVPTYMSEVSPKEKRGSYGVFHQLFITVGIFIAVLIGLPFHIPPSKPDSTSSLQDIEKYANWKLPTFDKVWWRVMLGLGIIPVLLVMFLLMFVYTFETPHYYVERREYGNAEDLLKALLSKEDVQEDLQDIKKSVEEGEKAKEQGMGLMAALKVPVYRHVILVGCLLSVFQQFSGINVFMASSNKLFSDAGLDAKLVTIMSTILTFVNMLMTFPAIPLIERLGRKTLLLGGCIGMFVSTVPGAICLWVDDKAKWATWIACIGAIVYIIFFAVSYGPILWVYLFEIYPIEIKGSAAGLATAVNWIGGIVMVFVSNFIDTKINYTIFAAMTAVAIVLVATLMRETKGRSLEHSPFMTDNNNNAAAAADV